MIQTDALHVVLKKCSVCKSKEKHHHKKYENNGIIGPGSRGWIAEEYLICMSCGIHYSDINKPKL